MSSDERHPSDFLHELASAIKAVRDRGGKWNRTADTIQWAYERIERLEEAGDTLITLTADRDQWKGRAEQLQEERDALESKLVAGGNLYAIECDRANRAERQLGELLRTLRMAAKIIGHPDDSFSQHMALVIANAQQSEGDSAR